MTAVAERPVAAPAPRPASHRADTSTPARKALSGSLLGLAWLTAWFVVYALILSPLQAHHDQGVLYSQFRQQVAEETAPVGGTPIAPDAPVAVIDFGAAGVHREVVVEGTSSGDLMKGPGHLRSSVLPGQAGISTIYGRAALFGGPFGRIAGARPGQTITVTTGEGIATYKVLGVVHAGQDVPPVSATETGRLLLVTAQSSGWRSGWSPSGTVYVWATLTSKPFAGSAGVQITKSEMPMQGDPSALYLLVFWLPLLLIAVIATLWAIARWGRWQAWLIGFPIIIAALWGVSQSAVQLLPNLT